MPFFSPIRRVGPDGFQGERGFDHRPIDALPSPGDAFQLVVLGEPLPPERHEYLLPLPRQEVLVDGTGAAEVGCGEGLPLAARAEDEDDRLEDLPGLHGFAAAPGAAAIRPALLPLPSGNEGLHPLPECIGDRPGSDCRHAPFVSYVPADRKILITDKL